MCANCQYNIMSLERQKDQLGNLLSQKKLFLLVFWPMLGSNTGLLNGKRTYVMLQALLIHEPLKAGAVPQKLV